MWGDVAGGEFVCCVCAAPLEFMTDRERTTHVNACLDGQQQHVRQQLRIQKQMQKISELVTEADEFESPHKNRIGAGAGATVKRKHPPLPAAERAAESAAKAAPAKRVKTARAAGASESTDAKLIGSAAAAADSDIESASPSRARTRSQTHANARAAIAGNANHLLSPSANANSKPNGSSLQRPEMANTKADAAAVGAAVGVVAGAENKSQTSDHTAKQKSEDNELNPKNATKPERSAKAAKNPPAVFASPLTVSASESAVDSLSTAPSLDVRGPTFTCVICLENLDKNKLDIRLAHIRDCAARNRVDPATLRELVVPNTLPTAEANISGVSAVADAKIGSAKRKFERGNRKSKSKSGQAGEWQDKTVWSFLMSPRSRQHAKEQAEEHTVCSLRREIVEVDQQIRLLEARRVKLMRKLRTIADEPGQEGARDESDPSERSEQPDANANANANANAFADVASERVEQIPVAIAGRLSLASPLQFSISDAPFLESSHLVPSASQQFRLQAQSAVAATPAPSIPALRLRSRSLVDSALSLRPNYRASALAARETIEFSIQRSLSASDGLTAANATAPGNGKPSQDQPKPSAASPGRKSPRKRLHTAHIRNPTPAAASAVMKSALSASPFPLYQLACNPALVVGGDRPKPKPRGETSNAKTAKGAAGVGVSPFVLDVIRANSEVHFSQSQSQAHTVPFNSPSSAVGDSPIPQPTAPDAKSEQRRQSPATAVSLYPDSQAAVAVLAAELHDVEKGSGERSSMTKIQQTQLVTSSGQQNTELKSTEQKVQNGDSAQSLFFYDLGSVPLSQSLLDALAAASDHVPSDCKGDGNPSDGVGFDVETQSRPRLGAAATASAGQSTPRRLSECEQPGQHISLDFSVDPSLGLSSPPPLERGSQFLRGALSSTSAAAAATVAVLSAGDSPSAQPGAASHQSQSPSLARSRSTSRGLATACSRARPAVSPLLPRDDAIEIGDSPVHTPCGSPSRKMMSLSQSQELTQTQSPLTCQHSHWQSQSLPTQHSHSHSNSQSNTAAGVSSPRSQSQAPQLSSQVAFPPVGRTIAKHTLTSLLGSSQDGETSAIADGKLKSKRRYYRAAAREREILVLDSGSESDGEHETETENDSDTESRNEAEADAQMLFMSLTERITHKAQKRQCKVNAKTTASVVLDLSDEPTQPPADDGEDLPSSQPLITAGLSSRPVSPDALDRIAEDEVAVRTSAERVQQQLRSPPAGHSCLYDPSPLHLGATANSSAAKPIASKARARALDFDGAAVAANSPFAHRSSSVPAVLSKSKHVTVQRGRGQRTASAEVDVDDNSSTEFADSDCELTQSQPGGEDSDSICDLTQQQHNRIRTASALSQRSESVTVDRENRLRKNATPFSQPVVSPVAQPRTRKRKSSDVKALQVAAPPGARDNAAAELATSAFGLRRSFSAPLPAGHVPSPHRHSRPVSAAPSSPVPDFASMSLQELAVRMDQYGMKAKGKRTMVKQLARIWRVIRGLPEQSENESKQLSKSRPRKRKAEAPGAVTAVALENGNGAPAAPNAKKAKKSNDVNAPPKKPRKAKVVAAASSVLADISNGAKANAKAKAAAAAPPSQNPHDSKDSKRLAKREEAVAQLREFIRNNDDLYIQVILFRTMEFNDLLLAVQAAGIKCTRADLQALVDSEGISVAQNWRLAGNRGQVLE